MPDGRSTSLDRLFFFYGLGKQELDFCSVQSILDSLTSAEILFLSSLVLKTS